MFNGWGWVFPVAGVVLAGFVFGDLIIDLMRRLLSPSPSNHGA